MGYRSCMETGQAAKLEFRLQVLSRKTVAQRRVVRKCSGSRGQTHGFDDDGMRTIASEADGSRNPPESRRRINMERVIRAYWDNHVTCPAGRRSGPDGSQYALPCYHVTCRHAESDSRRRVNAGIESDGDKVKTHQTHQRVEWAGQHQAHQQAWVHGGLTRSRGPGGHLPGPAGRQAGIATRVQCSSRSHRLLIRVSHQRCGTRRTRRGRHSHMAYGSAWPPLPAAAGAAPPGGTF